jgi:hypothetical protein
MERIRARRVRQSKFALRILRLPFVFATLRAVGLAGVVIEVSQTVLIVALILMSLLLGHGR